MRIKYDRSADAAYIQLAEMIGRGGVAFTYPCDPAEVSPLINLDFDEAWVLIGIEVLTASKALPASLLERGEVIG